MKRSAGRAVLEALKSLLIVALVFSALGLTYRIWYDYLPRRPEGIWGALWGGQTSRPPEHTAYEANAYALQLVSPLNAAVRTPEGLYAAPDRSAAAALYQRMSSVLAEALETASEPAPATDAQWEAALSGPMALFDFQGQAPLSALAVFLGAHTGLPEDTAARYLVLSLEDGGLYLYYKTGDSDIVRARTEADAAYFEGLRRDLAPNGGLFGYEAGLAPARDVALIPPRQSYPVLSVSPVLQSAAEADADRIVAEVLEGFGFNSFTARFYTEADGAQVYVEEEGTLRFYGDGRVVYSGPEAAEGAPDVRLTADAAVSAAARLAERVLTTWLGEATLYLQSAAYDAETGVTTVLFGAQAQGLRILTAEGYAMRVEFKGTAVSAADYALRGCRVSGGAASVIPGVQALAAAKVSSGGAGGFGLCYDAADGGEAMTAGWYIPAE